MTTTALALFEESDRPGGELPLLMQRPSEEGAAARNAAERHKAEMLAMLRGYK